MKKILLALALCAAPLIAHAQTKIVIAGVDSREYPAREKHLTEIVSELSAQMAEVIANMEVKLMDAVEEKKNLQARVDWWEKPENRAWADGR